MVARRAKMYHDYSMKTANSFRIEAILLYNRLESYGLSTGCYVAVKLANKLGTGLYSVSEAAQYARVSTRMLSRWLYGDKQGEAVLEPEYGLEEKIVSYLDLIQTLAVREIRIGQKVPLVKFRQAIEVARNQFDMPYPFAMRHVTYWNGDEIVIQPPHDGGFIEASGKQRGQRLFPFVEMYLKDLDFDDRGICSRYRIYERDGIVITMKPEIRFGEPMLPSGYSARALWEAVQIEGGLEQAAEAFEVPAAEIAVAYRFHVDYLAGKAAA